MFSIVVKIVETQRQVVDDVDGEGKKVGLFFDLRREEGHGGGDNFDDDVD